MASPRRLAAATVISRRSLTLAWPVNSENNDGRRVISSAASGFVKTSETARSATGQKMVKWRGSDKVKHVDARRGFGENSAIYSSLNSTGGFS